MIALLSMLLAAAPSAGPKPVPAAPAIQITLNNAGNFMPGGLVNVRVQTNEDGYLIVFRVDGDGRIRVLFPLDPDGDAFIRGGREYELRGRADRSTFLADDRGGAGIVYAAIAHDPLVFRDFSLNAHWDYDALKLRDSTTDAENDLTAIVSRMTNRARFDYDAVGYRVQDIAANVAATGYAGGGYYPGLYDPYYNPRWRCMACGWGYPGSQIAVDFGYSPFWDPYLYSPWGYNYGFGYGYGIGFGGGWFPVVVGHTRPFTPLPPGTRPRPRPMPSGGTNVNAPPPSGRSAPPPPATGTRARPRPADLTVDPSRRPMPDARPVFRQPPQSATGTSSGVRAEPQQQARPVYREAPQVYRAPPPPPPSAAPRSAPPPQQHSAPPSQQHSAPPARSRGGGRR